MSQADLWMSQHKENAVVNRIVHQDLFLLLPCPVRLTFHSKLFCCEYFINSTANILVCMPRHNKFSNRNKPESIVKVLLRNK